ncbi:NADH-quinone oxidoreductase subunit C [Nonomuraea dietziae]|uniref:NADH-quinone oxidoreductase subunit C n=1 Tax=Nonomuraea dietziae TaxID=65515 RepID=UPI003403E708
MTLTERFGDRVQVSESWGERTVDVAASDWIELLTFCRDTGYEFFDWLSGVDEPPDAFGVVAHVYNPSTHERLLLRTRVPRADPRLPSAVGVYRGANWHERETFEMFGVIFDDHPYLVPLLLPDGFEGHPLRKDFVLAARVAKAWPGAKEPGESGHGAPSRRKTLPPGVPADWPSPSTSTGAAAPPISGEPAAAGATAERPSPAGSGEPAPPGSESPGRPDAPGSPSTPAGSGETTSPGPAPGSPPPPADSGEAASPRPASGSQSSESRAPLEEPDG